MRPVVRERWLEFTGPLEGPGVPALYADIRGIPTVAYGNAVFTPADMYALPWMHPGGIPATQAEKLEAWCVINGNMVAAKLGWQYAAKLNALRLTREAMAELALAKLDANDRILLARLPEWEEHPACAQMALHSLAWACGANAHFPRLFDDVAKGDYEAASDEIRMNEWTPEGTHNAGLVPRNVANKILMRNAARVRDFHLDPNLLDWVHDLSVAAAVTQPALPDTPASSPTIVVDPVLHVDPAMYPLDVEPDEPA